MTSEVGQTLIYFDTNVFIDLIEGETASTALLMELASKVVACSGSFVTSEITLAEVLAPSRIFGPRSRSLKRRYMQAIAGNPLVELIPVSRAILIETVEFRERSGLKLADAIHCVCALQSKCGCIVSRDRGLERALPAEIAYCDGSVPAIRSLIDQINA